MFRSAIKYLALLINLFFSLMYIFGLLAAVVPSNKFVWFSYFGLFFPLLVLIQLGFGIFWLFRRHKWYCLISFGLLILTLPAVNRVFSVPLRQKTAVAQRPTLKLLTYNISIFSGEKKYKEIMRLIEEQDADIVCLQEFGFYNRNSRLNEKDILTRFYIKYPYRHLWYKNQRGDMSWGVATFSKYPIIKKRKVNYASAYNVSIYSDIVINGDTLRLFNNHLESNKFTLGDMKRYKELSDNFNSEKLRSVTEKMSTKLSSAYRVRAKQAQIIAEEIAQSPYPVVACGDFNDVPQSYAYHTIAKNMTDIIIATKWGYHYTFHSNGILVNIDHVLASKNRIIPLSSNIIHIDYSDHYPVLAEFQIKH